jgi:Glycosyl transferase family 2
MRRPESWLRSMILSKKTSTPLSGGFTAGPSWLRRTVSAVAAKILARLQVLRYSGLTDRSGLFIRNYYLSQNPDVARSGVNPLRHYFIRGAMEGRDPHPLFSTRYYLSHNSDVTAWNINPLVHYLTRGANQGRDPHPIFNTRFYLSQNPDVAMSGVNAFKHYCEHGAKEGRDPHPLFNTRYYLSQAPNLAREGLNPLVHYLERGAKEGRDPHPLFSTRYYLSQNPNVAREGINPLVHYLNHGAYEGYDPHPTFDSIYYLNQNPDVANAGLNPLVHFVGPGVIEGRNPNPFFGTSAYLEKNPEVALKEVNPLVYYLNSIRFDLRTALRNELAESPRLPLASDHDLHPLVSVIILCFGADQEKFLEDALLSSLLGSSYPLEIIVVVDASTDPRSALVEQLAARYKFISIPNFNLTKGDARNLAIQRARGEFVQFLEVVDLLAPGKIDVQIDEFRFDPEVEICISDYELCDAEGWHHWTPNKPIMASFQSPRNHPRLECERAFSIPIHCALFRKTFLMSTQFLSANVGQDDRDFWAAISSHSPKIAWNDAVLAISRISIEKASPDLKSGARNHESNDGNDGRVR